MSQIVRNNHFVQQAYLRRWSSDGIRVWEYAVLVPHTNFPEWRAAPIKSIASHTDLYTTIENGAESDRFETWMNEEFETPATPALTKLVEDQPLTKEEWERVALYVAAQHLRTPASFLEQKKRWEKTIPEMISDSLERAVKKVENARRRGKRLPEAQRRETDRVPLRISYEPATDSNLVLLRAEVTAGRQLWLHNMRGLLTRTARALVRHTWSVLRPSQGLEWFTSDNPVLCLNYYRGGRYDFGGGWGRPGSEILMPLSPYHLLYTKVGAQIPISAGHTS